MSYPFNDDHDMIRDAARGWLSDWYTDRANFEKSTQPDTRMAAWHGFGVAQGFAGIAIDEAYGGAGLGLPGRAVVLEEIGRTLFSSPFFGCCCLAADIVQTFGTDTARADLLPQIATGQSIIALVDGTQTLTLKDGGVSGRVDIVLDAQEADQLLVLIPNGDSCSLVIVKSGIKGLGVEPLETLDISFSKSAMIFNNVHIDKNSYIGTALLADIKKALVVSYGALGALCVGGAHRCLDMTVGYTKERIQFDRPIASFQAIKHRCADMFSNLETARSAAYYAAIAPEAMQYEAALIAKAWCTEAYFDIASNAIQLHGGIGFTWEYPLHYFFKQARMLKSLMGSSSYNYDLLADEIGLSNYESLS